MEDVVKGFGLLSLGTRMKRIGERLQADTQEIMGRLGLSLLAGQFPYLAALERLGPLGIGELSQALGVAQPGVTRSVGQLVALGLVETASPSGDQRRRVVSLSSEGRRLVERSRETVWPAIETAVADLCGPKGDELLALLSAIEDGLTERSLAKRIRIAEGEQ